MLKIKITFKIILLYILIITFFTYCASTPQNKQNDGSKIDKEKQIIIGFANDSSNGAEKALYKAIIRYIKQNMKNYIIYFNRIKESENIKKILAKDKNGKEIPILVQGLLIHTDMFSIRNENVKQLKKDVKKSKYKNYQFAFEISIETIKTSILNIEKTIEDKYGDAIEIIEKSKHKGGKIIWENDSKDNENNKDDSKIIWNNDIDDSKIIW